MERLLLRVTEAAEIAGISRSHAYALVKSGIWPSLTVGSSIRIPLAGLRRWVNDQTVGPAFDPTWLDADEEGEPRLVRR
jgi:excisionase family DNA binding protein